MYLDNSTNTRHRLTPVKDFIDDDDNVDDDDDNNNDNADNDK